MSANYTYCTIGTMERLTYKTDEERRRFCLSKGIEPAQHCCLDMAWFISEPVEWESQRPNAIITWIGAWNEYQILLTCRDDNGIVLYINGTSIYFCPWCGQRLPASLREEWYQTLYNMG